MAIPEFSELGQIKLKEPKNLGQPNGILGLHVPATERGKNHKISSSA